MAGIAFLYHQKDLSTEFKLFNFNMKEIKYSTQDINAQDIYNVSRTLKNDFITQGPLVSKFELALSKKCKSKYAIALSNASNGLIIACEILNLKKNDYVWCSAVTFISTISCAIHLNSKFDLIDISLEDYNIDFSVLEKKLQIAKKQKKLPKIIIVTHLGGNPIDLKKISFLKKKYKFNIIEDASHALGASVGNNPVGSCTYSDATIFSFHPVKSITTGEGGAITLNNKINYIKAKQLISHGLIRNKKLIRRKYNGIWDYDIFKIGYNFRLSDINCSLGISQLKRLNKFIKIRNQIAKNYDKFFMNHSDIITPKINNKNKSSFHLYIVRIKRLTLKKKKKLFEIMKKKKINLNFHYIPINKFHVFYTKFKNKKFKNSETYYNEAISLPIHSKLNYGKIKFVANNLINALDNI